MFESMRITAHLRTPVISDASLPIDGPLLFQAMRATYGPQDITLPGALTVPLVDLPLEKRGTGDQWYYAASFAQWEGTVAEGTDHWNKRFDNEYSGLVDFRNKRGKVIVEQGRYKAYHMPVFYRHALTVHWYAVGDIAEVSGLLRTLLHIGKKTSQGWGRVKWLVTPWPDDWSVYGPDGQLMRAIPADTGILAGYRPPYHLPEHQTVCQMP